VAKILIAASPKPCEIMRRILRGHNLACAESMHDAEEFLHKQAFDLIVCTILFDDSRMFDFLRLAKSRPDWRGIPFVCTRAQVTTIPNRVAIEAVAFTCKALGAEAFLDIANREKDPESGMRRDIEELLKAPGRKCSNDKD
jgi:CheY-like chemotaxis protein